MHLVLVSLATLILTSAPSAPAHRAAPTLRVTDHRKVGSAPEWKTSAGINATNTLHFAADLPATAPGHHRVTFFVYRPGGEPYTRLDVTYAVAVPRIPGEMETEAVGQGVRVWAEMPVSGTPIEAYDLQGVWAARMVLDDAATPVASMEFVLREPAAPKSTGTLARNP